MESSLPEPLPLPVKNWYLYLTPSITIYFGGLLLLLFTNVVRSIVKASCIDVPEEVPSFKLKSTRDLVADFVSGRTFLGQIQVAVVFSLSLTSFSLYLADASWTSVGVPIRYAINWKNNTLLQVDFACNVVFLLQFALRFFSATDKVWLWLSWQTMVDAATIPTCFVYIALNEYWSALRFFRVMHIITLPELLQTAGLLTDSAKMRLIQFAVRFISLWFVSAGFVHLLENSGDPWLSWYDGQTLAYWQCVYYLIVTSSTVGYGDIVCKTVLGQTFACGYIFVGLAMFANALPEVLKIVQFTSPYKGRLTVPQGNRHVLVCGCVTVESAAKFMNIFLHPDWGPKDVMVAFISPEMPSMEFQALLKRQKHAFFICGNEMDAKDLDRVAVGDADACIILANQDTDDPDDEDSANVMRAVAIKNVNGRIRILIQLLLERNKPHFRTIPNWSPRDIAVCLDELKMGILATNCWAPGFATFLSLVMRQFDSAEIDSREEGKTQAVYLRGSGMEVYESDLSPDFVGMNFVQVAELCFSRLRLLLFAVMSQGKILLNPGIHYNVKEDDRGFFIAESAEAVERAFWFCKTCHLRKSSSELNASKLSRCCSCKNGKSRKTYYHNRRLQYFDSQNDGEVIHTKRLQSLLNREKQKTNAVTIELDCSTLEVAELLMCPEDSEADINCVKCSHFSNPISRLSIRKSVLTQPEPITEERFDFTGAFYWCSPRRIDAAKLSLDDARAMNFKKHVVLCVFGARHCARLGLRNFVMPLRSSNHSVDELMPIVIIGDINFIRNEWQEVNVFPGIFIISASPMKRNVLRAVNLEKCKMSVIVAARTGAGNQKMLDKNAILCYLNIKSMKFGTENDSDTDNELYEKPKGSFQVGSTSTIRSKTKSFLSYTQRRAPQSAAPTIANNVPVLADVALPENVLVLDDDITHTMNTPLVLMNPFACGNIFAGDVLDSVICTAYFNPSSVKLVRELVTGGSTAETDRIFEEGLDLCEGTNVDLINANRNRARVTEISLSDPEYEEYCVSTDASA